MSKYKCPECDKKIYTEKDALFAHLESDHSDAMPEDWSGARYYFYKLYGRDYSNCLIDGAKTSWNDVTNRPNKLCDKDKCRQLFREQFKQRMIGKYGKVHLLNDPKMQNTMLMNRSISGNYTWSDGTQLGYTGSYHEDFLKFLDVFLNFNSKDIFSPAPQTFYYEYEGKQHFYLPDVYIESINTIIEIKDGGNNKNTHPKIINVDKVKEKLKDDVMKSQKEYNYIKIVNKEYGPFIELLTTLKQNYVEHGKVLKPITIISEHSKLLENEILKTKSIPKELYFILYSSEYSNVDYDNVAISFHIDFDKLYCFDIMNKSLIHIKYKNDNSFKDKKYIIMKYNGQHNVDELYKSVEKVKEAYSLGNVDDKMHKSLDDIVNDFTFFNNLFKYTFNEPLINEETEDNECIVYTNEDYLKCKDLSTIYAGTDLSKYKYQTIIQDYVSKIYYDDVHMLDEATSKEPEIQLTPYEMDKVKKKFPKIECSFHKTEDGKYYCRTHRARSKYYDSIEDIPVSAVNFINTTS